MATKVRQLGIVADDNGAVRREQKGCAKHGWYDATLPTCPTCAAEPPKQSTAERLAALEKDHAELRALTLTLAEGLSVSRAAWREAADTTVEGINNLQFSYSTVASRVRTLEVEAQRANEGVAALNSFAQGAVTMEQYDALHADVMALREEVEAVRSLLALRRTA